MADFTSIGYAASNELDPSMWREYMLEQLRNKDKNMVTDLRKYREQQKARKEAESAAQRQQALGILGKGFGFMLGGPAGAAAGGALTDGLSGGIFGVDSNSPTQYYG